MQLFDAFSHSCNYNSSLSDIYHARDLPEGTRDIAYFLSQFSNAHASLSPQHSESLWDPKQHGHEFSIPWGFLGGVGLMSVLNDEVCFPD